MGLWRRRGLCVGDRGLIRLAEGERRQGRDRTSLAGGAGTEGSPLRRGTLREEGERASQGDRILGCHLFVE